MGLSRPFHLPLHFEPCIKTGHIARQKFRRAQPGDVRVMVALGRKRAACVVIGVHHHDLDAFEPLQVSVDGVTVGFLVKKDHLTLEAALRLVVVHCH
jgi:hypothetical protein